MIVTHRTRCETKKFKRRKFEKDIDFAKSNIENFDVFKTCNTIKITNFQLDYVEMYKKLFNLMSSCFNKRATRRKVSIFDFELIFFMNDLNHSIEYFIFEMLRLELLASRLKNFLSNNLICINVVKLLDRIDMSVR